jgi:hypothetical protein
MTKDKKERLARLQATVASFLFQAVADGTLRRGLTAGTAEAREGMTEDERAILDAQIEETIAHHGLEGARKRQ